MKLKLTILAVAVAIIPSAGFGLGIRVVDQDAFATARGEAFTATADNPSAIYYNPAGITQLAGDNFSIGAYGIYLQTKYTDFTGTSYRTKDRLQGVPQIYYTHTFKDVPLSLGFGVYSPYGFGLEYPDNVPFRQLALQGSVKYLTVNPVLAWKINNQLSIAAGVTVNYADANLQRGILPFPNNRFQFTGHGYDIGYNLGILWQPAKEHSFGLNYHSVTNINLDGHSIVNIPGAIYTNQKANTDFRFPQFFMAGYSYRPTPEWNFELDLDWADWHALKTLTLNQQYSGQLAIPFNWQSSFMGEFGVTRYFGNGFHVSGGYIFSQNSVPTSSFNPIVPDSNRHILSVGVGQKRGNYTWDLAYQFAYGPPRSVNNGTLGDGEYRFIGHALTLSFGYHF